MNRYTAITISRDFGAGGSDLAWRLSRALSWRVFDNNLPCEAAGRHDLPARCDEQPARWFDACRPHPPQEWFRRKLWELGRKECTQGAVFVGRGMRHLLAYTPGVLHVRLIAPLKVRALRVARRLGIPLEDARQMCREVEHARQRWQRFCFRQSPRSAWEYDLVVNTACVGMSALVAGLARLLRGQPWRTPSFTPNQAVVTLASDLGAAPPDFSRQLADRLRLRLFDNQLLHLVSRRIGAPSDHLEIVDEQRLSWLRRWTGDRLEANFVDAIADVVVEEVRRGRALLVGRGANHLLHRRRSAFHLRLTASPDERMLRLMAERGLDEQAAACLRDRSDRARAAWHRAYFGADYADPLHYHLTAHPGRLDAESVVGLVSFLAIRHWRRALPRVFEARNRRRKGRGSEMRGFVLA
jgi:cytidylate kinase